MAEKQRQQGQASGKAGWSPEETALLFEEQQELDFALPVELITDADAAVAGISVPFHKGAERYYESRGEKSEN